MPELYQKIHIIHYLRFIKYSLKQSVHFLDTETSFLRIVLKPKNMSAVRRLKKNMKKKLIILLVMTTATALAQTLDKKAVDNLDLNKYAGKWYEIARFDHRFERGLADVTAEYELLPDGYIKVTNVGYRDGVRSVSYGKARRRDDTQAGRLEVSFFLWFYSDYNVLKIDDEYENVLVGSSSDKYLWILSRNPNPDRKVVRKLVEEARRRGYDTEKLIWIR
jgi:Bacterial lipocalin